MLMAIFALTSVLVGLLFLVVARHRAHLPNREDHYE